MMTRADNECKVTESIVTCRTCKGSGIVEVLDESDPLGYHESETKQCPSCMGSGILRRIEMLNVYYTQHLPSGRDKQFTNQ